MTVLPQNDRLTQICDAGYHPLNVILFRGETIIYLSEEEIERMICEWYETKKQPEGLFICADAGGWTACEGQTGECYVEWFHYEEYALRWLVYADGDDTDKLHRLDDLLFKRQEAKS